MKITFCDVCFRTKKTYIKSTHRISWSGRYETLRLDVCIEHQDFFKVCETYDEAQTKVRELKVIE